MPRLIATDLDGTLLGPDGQVARRTIRALRRAREAGILVVPVTARQPIGLRPVAREAGLDGWALCGNGALGLRLGAVDRPSVVAEATVAAGAPRARIGRSQVRPGGALSRQVLPGEVLFAREVPVAVQRALAEELLARVPGVVFVSIRDGGQEFVAQTGYADLADVADHKRDPRQMGSHSLDIVLERPGLKLVARHPRLGPVELLGEVREIQALGLSGFEATRSGAPFVEIMAEGVTKASGLALLCGRLGIAAPEVVAFGDAENDIEMLAWAGHGVAMGNAETIVRAAADEIAPTNADDGVAQVVERLLLDGG